MRNSADAADTSADYLMSEKKKKRAELCKTLIKLSWTEKEFTLEKNGEQKFKKIVFLIFLYRKQPLEFWAISAVQI